MSMERCIHCDAAIDTDRDDSCYIDDQPVCPRCRGDERVVVRDHSTTSPQERSSGYDQTLKVRWIGRARYNQEVIHNLAMTLDHNRGGWTFGNEMPEPMGDCIIEEPTIPTGVSMALVIPGPRYTIKLDDNVFDADSEEGATAIVQRYREAHV
jgi:hypothetical protein